MGEAPERITHDLADFIPVDPGTVSVDYIRADIAEALLEACKAFDAEVGVICGASEGVVTARGKLHQAIRQFAISGRDG